jgi:hypothetical protein
MVLAAGGRVQAQEPASAGAPPEETMRNMAAPCLQPPPLVKWADYRGPLQKVAGIFARKLERKSAHPRHYKPGTLFCSFAVKDKFALLVHDTFDPASFFSAGFNASLDQAANRDPTFGQGAAGYGRRYAADFAGQSTWRFFKDFAYPTAFSEDPRYYRLGHGGTGKRLFHAAAHTFIAYRDSGKYMFNYSEWLGTVSAVALNSAYHPGDVLGFTPVVRQVGFSFIQDAGFDVLREFWPEIARKLRMPFRDIREQPGLETRR